MPPGNALAPAGADASSEYRASRIFKPTDVATNVQGEQRYERANTLTRPGSLLHSTMVMPWSSTRRRSEFVS